MPSAVLRIPNCWTPVDKTRARRLGLAATPLGRTHTASDVGLVLDRSRWLEQPVGQRWMVAFRVADQGGQPIISEVRVFPYERNARRPPGLWSGTYGGAAHVPRGGITARLLRDIRMKLFQTALQAIVAQWSRELAAIEVPWVRPSSDAVSNRGRKGRPEIELARMAEVYQQAYGSGRYPIRVIARKFRISPTQARDAILRARRVGLLSPAKKQGSVGGLLTTRARAVLKQRISHRGKRKA